MSKVTKHNLQMQIDTLTRLRVSMQAEINGMKEWISELEKQQTQPNVSLPKSTRYDAEVLSRLDSLEARVAKVEEVIKTEPDPEPKKEQKIVFEKERKIVFDWYINQEGKAVVPYSDPNEFDRIEEFFQLGEKAFLFKAYLISSRYTLIYIGHYE
jgi:hypothetical protein